MSDTPDRGPHHSDETGGDNVILIQFTAEMVPHDSPEFQERARRAAERPIPDYLKDKPKPTDEPPAQ